jgi:biofilm protein TabA
MYKSYLLLSSLYLLFASSCSPTSHQQGSEPAWTAKKADNWFKKKEWANGLRLEAGKETNTLEFARQYEKNKVFWDEAFTYLKDHDLEQLPAGKYVIDGENVFATVTEGPNKDFDKTGWESHRKYVDLQYIIKGAEKIGIAQVSKAEVIRPYEEARDAANYKTEGEYVIAKPGTFYLFFPQDAHRPGIKVEGFDTVKKITIKVRSAS